MRILGIDPGLRRTGWAVLDATAGRLGGVASGHVTSSDDGAIADRLDELYAGLEAVIAAHAPAACAVEEVFVNRNPTSTLKLGMARGVCLLAPARAGLTVAEYGAGVVKKAVVGTGRAEKAQVQAMVAQLVPNITLAGEDAADALAVAVCHSHHAATRAGWHAGAHAAGGGAP